MKIVGLDCATVDAKVGLALAVLGEEGLEIQHVTLCTREQTAANVVAGWLRDTQDAVLIAIDAPLGWPKPLAETLINHSAGMPIETPANAMFRRATDLFIQQKLKKLHSMSARTESLARPTQLWLFSALFARSLECRFHWRGRRPRFHLWRRSRSIPRPLCLLTGSRRVGTKKRVQTEQRREIVEACELSLRLANQCLI